MGRFSDIKSFGVFREYPIEYHFNYMISSTYKRFGRILYQCRKYKIFKLQNVEFDVMCGNLYGRDCNASRVGNRIPALINKIAWINMRLYLLEYNTIWFHAFVSLKIGKKTATFSSFSCINNRRRVSCAITLLNKCVFKWLPTLVTNLVYK